MKAVRAVRIALMLAGSTLAALAQPKAKAPTEQRYFNLVNAVQTPVELSDAELAALSSDSLMRKLSPGSTDPKPTQEGLEATVVALCGAGERDLIVIGNGRSLATTYSGPFWIIRDLPAGPTIVFSGSSLSLSLDTKRSNKCLNIDAFSVTATDGINTDYKFDGQKYVVSKERSTKLP